MFTGNVGSSIGFDIIENPLLTVPGEPCEVKRTLKERLFTKPWQPFKATKTITPQVPSKQIFRIENKLICHPAIAAQIKRQLSLDICNKFQN